MEINKVLKLVHDRTKKIKNSKQTGLIQYSVRWKGTTKFVTTGIHVRKNQFDKKTMTVINHPEQDEINARFIKKRKGLKSFLYEDDNKSIEQLVNFIKGKTSLLYEYCLNYIESISHTRKRRTVENYQNALTHLQAFKPHANLKEVNRQFVRDFQNYLFRQTINQQGETMKKGSVRNIVSMFKTMITEAVEDELIQKDPFRKYRRIQIQNKERNKAPTLSDIDLERLEAFQPENDKKKWVDLFLFSCYTFLPFIELKTLSIEHIEENKGLIKIVKTRVKTDRYGKIFYLPLSKMPTGAKAIEILNQYTEGKKGKDLIFPFINHNKTYLRVLAKIALKVSLSVIPTSHSGRQTCVQWYKLHTDLTNEQIGKMSCQSPEIVAQYAGNENERLENALDRINFIK